jgi:hypothetical protein
MAREVNNDQQLHIRLPANMVKQARIEARKQKRPLSEIMRDLLRAWLAEQTRPVQALK